MAEALGQQGISTGVYYPIPAHRQAAVQPLGLGEGVYPVAERMAQEVLAIPVHPALTDADRLFIVDSLISQGA